MAGRRARGARSAAAPRAQHFLRSPALARTLVDGAGVAPGDLVLDLGAGRGIITAALLERGARARAVELDPSLVRVLRTRFEGDERVSVEEADARLVEPPGTSFVVVSNLPFDGATQILRRLLDDPRVPLARAAVVVQWEAAAKLAAAWPTTLLAAYWGAWYELAVVRRLDRDAFSPPPLVAGGVLRIERRGEPLVGEAVAGAYRAFLRRGFRDGPRSVVPRTQLLAAARAGGFARTPRARDLSAPEWAALFAATASGPAATLRRRHAPL